MNPYTPDYLGLGYQHLPTIQNHLTIQAAQQANHNQEYLAYMANMQAQASPAMLNALGMGLAAQASQFMWSPAPHPDRIEAIVQEAEREARGWKTRDELKN